ncbi:universal stress protein [Kribbella sp. NPDC020789]
MSTDLPVLVGIDGSKDGLIALRWAAWYAGVLHARLEVVHVVDERDLTPGGPPRPELDDGSETLQDALGELERIGFANARLEVRNGHPAKVLLELSRQAQALVVGRRGLGGFAELVLGSTSQICTALSTDVPLVVVPDTWDPIAERRGRIVVGVDGSLDGQDALRFAFELAAATGTPILALHAVVLPESYPDPNVWADPHDQLWSRAADELLGTALDGWQTKYPDVVAERRSVAAHPVMALAHESAAADLVVVGGLGRTSFSELRLGSVARGLLHHARCPIAVIHHA